MLFEYSVLDISIIHSKTEIKLWKSRQREAMIGEDKGKCISSLRRASMSSGSEQPRGALVLVYVQFRIMLCVESILRGSSQEYTHSCETGCSVTSGMFLRTLFIVSHQRLHCVVPREAFLSVIIPRTVGLHLLLGHGLM